MASKISFPPSPFDAADDSVDLVIHTSDDDRFYVSKCLLIYASPFFANLFKDSAPAERYQDLPVWRAPDSSTTVTALLRLCYPIHIDLRDILLPGVDFRALQKYLMEGSMRRLRVMMLRSPKSTGFVPKNPLRIVAIARYMRWGDVLRRASRELLRLRVRDHPDVTELDLLSVREYRRLIQWCWACGDAAARTVASIKDCSMPGLSVRLRLKGRDSQTSPWVDKTLLPSMIVGVTERPGCDLEGEFLVEWTKLAHKENPQPYDTDIKEFINAIQKRVDESLPEKLDFDNTRPEVSTVSLMRAGSY